MRQIGLALTLALLSSGAFADDTYEQEGVGYSQSSVEACSDALLYIKKQVLISSGAIITSEVPAGKSKQEKPADHVESAGVNNLSDEFVKVLSKEELAHKDRKGNFVCVVKARLSADVPGIIKHNLAYKGKLPTWVVVPPEGQDKITVIAKSATLDGAIARVLHKYAEKIAGERDRVHYIEQLLDGKNKPYVHDIQITPEIGVKWKRKYYMLGGKTDPLFIHTFVEQTIFNSKGKVRHISSYREIESENGFASNFEDESSGETRGRLNINKAGATLKMLVDSLKSSGFEVQYTQVATGTRKEWYALLVGSNKPLSIISPSPQNK